MFKQTLLVSALAGLVALTGAQAGEQVQMQQQGQEQIYGSQLMTPQERADYRAKMRSLKTEEERQALRLEHHKLMQERAKQMGITLPEMPPTPGGGMGPGGMMGPGSGGMMGPGGGGMMGPGGMGRDR